MFHNSSYKGQILSELLIAITIAVVLAALGAQLISVSLTSTKTSKEKSEAIGLAQEGMEAIRAVIRGNDASSQGWNRVYLPPDGSGNASTSKGSANPYYPEIVSNIWQITSGTENISLAGEIYTRKIIIENVSRDANNNIESTYNSVNDDPTTQKITVIVSKTNAPDVSLLSYMSRYINESVLQTGWNGGLNDGPFSATSTTNTNYGANTETSKLDLTDNIKLKTQ